ncbi:WD40-repeat-containing domain protein [Tuber borchii]|uniref:WD40-repeat-containing domain protein n=1 Tax=Tuber borchii TaxID=42251 RepID=A0A2T6ZDT2_TUBBO|nr:WD40-repeat-containing domain protein [Tuber borchii]
MYTSHRGMVPAPNSRLTELLEQVRQEFADQQSRSSDYEHKIQQQIQEMDLVRQTVFQLEAAHGTMKQKYEDEIARLNRELDARGGAHVAPHGSQNAGPSVQPPPPSLPAGAGLFVGIMAGNNGQGGPGLVPPPLQESHPQAPHHSIPPPPASLPQQVPPSQPPQQLQQQQQQQQQPPVYPSSSFVNGGYGNPAPQPTASPGPGKSRRPGGPGGPATPQQNQPPNYNSDPRGSPQVARPRSPASCLGDLEYDRVPANQKKEGPDWFAIFNPKVPRLLDVDLVHTLEHNSVVCCVRFSQDGKFVATGCNRSAQIYDVKSGTIVSRLQDETVDRDGDLYIRSVCFSPDGRYLATGAEDKQIRVWDIPSRTIKQTFHGHEQDIYSLDFARNGRHIASGSGDRTVRVWDIESGQNVLTLSIEDGVTTVAISPDGRYVAAGSLDKSVRVWDAQSGYLVERLEGAEGHKDSVYSVAFAPNGRDLVSGSLDKTIKMWELSAARGLMPGGGTSRGKCVKTFEGHKDFVLSVALTPDGNWVLSGSKDRGVQFWDPRTASAQLMLQGHKNSVISVAPSPSGGLFATGSGDMRARIWRYWYLDDQDG